ncbi:MAG: hypothetical protein FWE22_05470 [Firmicutes bacterium]|nr:hypothetical protein [Bacillota bacterium]
MKTKLKQMVMKSVMKKRKANQNFNEAESDLVGLPDDADETINNSDYVKAHDKEGNAFFMRLGRRGGKDGDDPVAEIWFGFCTADGKAYMNSQELYKLSESPIIAECIEPLKEWKFSFKGKVVPVVPGKDRVAEPCGEEIDAEFEGIFTSKQGLFEMARDTHIDSYCRGIAAEKWKKGFSEELKKNHQTRTEQVGHIKCSFKAEGKSYTMDTAALRDRAFGRRLWSYMNHYAWLVGQLEDGRYFNAVMVRYPSVNVIGLKTGYIFENGIYYSLKNLNFPEHFTTTGIAPVKDSATAEYSNGESVKIDFEAKIYFPYKFYDAEGGYDVFEGVTEHVYNGIKGYGITEFSYNHDRSRLNTKRQRE